MALPKLLQKLFQNGGAGSKLNESIMPYAYARSVNGKQPDSVGNIEIPARNVGDEWHSFTGQIPAGGVPYCGQEVTRSTYADLWAYAQNNGLVKTETEWQSLSASQNGNVPFYSSGDGSTTFRMPKVVGYIKGAASQAEAGTYTAEGLPNIEGFINKQYLKAPIDATQSGALSLSGNIDNCSVAASSGGFSTLSFDASKSNSIYGNSNHVTPETSAILFGVYAFGEITNVGALDADTLATGLATLEANKLSRDDKTEIANWAMPSDASNKITYSVSATAQRFTAPVCGWFCLTATAKSQNGWAQIHNLTSDLVVQMQRYTSGSRIKTFLPVQKGATVSVNYEACTINEFYLVPCNASV